MRLNRLTLVDRPDAMFVALSPVVLALLVFVVPRCEGLGPRAPEAASEPSRLLVVLIVGAAFIGSAAAATEFVCERPIVTLERSASLAPQAYLAVKLAVFAGVCVPQAVQLILTARMVKPIPSSGALSKLGRWRTLSPLRSPRTHRACSPSGCHRWAHRPRRSCRCS